jgi:hypothetical protein
MCMTGIVIALYFSIVFEFNHAKPILSNLRNAMKPITNKEDYF